VAAQYVHVRKVGDDAKVRTALVTGGTKGIGLAICDRLARDGVKVYVCSRTRPSDSFPYLWAYCDALEEKSIEDMAEICSHVDILVNNIGGGGRWGTDFLGTEFATYTDVFSKNAWAALRFTRLCLPHMITQKWGRVVTIASIYGAESGGKAWFNMAKSAEISLMKVLSQDKALVRANVTFNSVCPGHISVKGKPDEEDLDSLPLGRMGRPEEVASVVAFLCREEASFVNGSRIMVDGGESHVF
jgi:3-oxoacyl-[acyl-carrier protein] reductase